MIDQNKPQMTHKAQSQQKKPRLPVLIEPLISTLHNIQLKIDSAAGAATALELRLRIIAQLENKVQIELKRKTKKPFYKAELEHLIFAVLEVFKEKLDPTEHNAIIRCRPPRNKLIHASLVELMINLNGEALGREVDPNTGKGKPLAEDDLVEGAKCIERSRGLDIFSQRAREAVVILETKILRSIKP